MEGLAKANELNCDEAATEYVPWNKAMGEALNSMGYIQSRIEVVKKLK